MRPKLSHTVAYNLDLQPLLLVDWKWLGHRSGLLRFKKAKLKGISQRKPCCWEDGSNQPEDYYVDKNVHVCQNIF